MDQNNSQNQQDENALEKPAEELNALQSLSSTDTPDENVKAAPDEVPLNSSDNKKHSKIRKFFAMFNVYLLIFGLLLIIAGVVFIVSYLNSQKEPEQPVTALQNLTQEQLAEIANGDANVGDPRYVLNIQSDAVFAGNALIRGDLNVAGSLQLGQGLTIPGLTVSGPTNLAATQINNLSVAQGSVFQGAVTLQSDLTARNANFGGTVTASTLNVGSLNLAGNGALTLSNHIRTAGGTPNRTQNNAVGAGGSTSNSGSDIAGTLNVNTGSNTSAGCFATITFNQRFTRTPKVIVSPVGSGAGSTNYYVDRSPSNFSICTSSPAPAGRSFAFDYFVID